MLCNFFFRVFQIQFQYYGWIHNAHIRLQVLHFRLKLVRVENYSSLFSIGFFSFCFVRSVSLQQSKFLFSYANVERKENTTFVSVNMNNIKYGLFWVGFRLCQMLAMNGAMHCAHWGWIGMRRIYGFSGKTIHVDGNLKINWTAIWVHKNCIIKCIRFCLLLEMSDDRYFEATRWALDNQ